MAILFSIQRGDEKSREKKVILMAETKANELSEYGVFTVCCA